MASVAPEWALSPHATIPRGLPVLVCILDGWGENENKDEWNACHAATTPHVDKLRAVGASRWRTVRAHGPAVGLPTWDDMGNSEVGHNALGAGQLIDQGARLVDKALSDGTLFTQDGWQYISSAFKEHTVHFIGLLSSGGVHSRANQLYQSAYPQRGSPAKARLRLRAGCWLARRAPRGHEVCKACRVRGGGAHMRADARRDRFRRRRQPLTVGSALSGKTARVASRRADAASPPARTVLRGCAKTGVKRVRVHILLDGRDVPDGSSIADMAELQKARAGRAVPAPPRRALPPRGDSAATRVWHAASARRRLARVARPLAAPTSRRTRRFLHFWAALVSAAPPAPASYVPTATHAPPVHTLTLAHCPRACGRPVRRATRSQVLDEISAEGVDARVASGGGRMYMTMDRCAAVVAAAWRRRLARDAWLLTRAFARVCVAVMRLTGRWCSAAGRRTCWAARSTASRSACSHTHARSCVATHAALQGYADAHARTSAPQPRDRCDGAAQGARPPPHTRYSMHVDAMLTPAVCIFLYTIPFARRSRTTTSTCRRL
jgi:hypothetical protein